MKSIVSTIVLLMAVVAVKAEDDELVDMAADPRIFFVNFTSSLVQVNATILTYALIALAVLGAAAIALYYLFLESQNSSSGYGYSDGYGQSSGYNYQYAR